MQLLLALPLATQVPKRALELGIWCWVPPVPTPPPNSGSPVCLTSLLLVMGLLADKGGAIRSSCQSDEGVFK